MRGMSGDKKFLRANLKSKFLGFFDARKGEEGVRTFFEGDITIREWA